MAFKQAEKPMTIAQAKRAYKKRGPPQPTEQERRQAARAEELDRRAQAIRDREQRKKANAAKRAEKEAKDRETRRRMGRKEPTDGKRLSPRQTRMGAFFRAGRIQDAVELDSAEDTTAESVSVDLTTDLDDSGLECEVIKTKLKVPGSIKADSAVLGQKPSSDLMGRKRKREGQKHSKFAPSTQPEKPVSVDWGDGVFPDKRRLYVPPSQGYNEYKRHKSYDLRLELPSHIVSRLDNLAPSPDRISGSPNADASADLSHALAQQPDLEDEFAAAARLFSSGTSVTDLLSSPPNPASDRTGDARGQLVGAAQISGTEEQALYNVIAEFRSSQLIEAMDTMQDVLDVTESAQAASGSNDAGIDTLVFSDGLEISCEEVIQLEQEALQKTDKVASPDSAGPQRSSRIVRPVNIASQLQGCNTDPGRLTALDESFGFGSFEFTSQELREVDP